MQGPEGTNVQELTAGLAKDDAEMVERYAADVERCVAAYMVANDGRVPENLDAILAEAGVQNPPPEVRQKLFQVADQSAASKQDPGTNPEDVKKQREAQKEENQQTIFQGVAMMAGLMLAKIGALFGRSSDEDPTLQAMQQNPDLAERAMTSGVILTRAGASLDPGDQPAPEEYGTMAPHPALSSPAIIAKKPVPAQGQGAGRSLS